MRCCGCASPSPNPTEWITCSVIVAFGLERCGRVTWDQTSGVSRASHIPLSSIALLGVLLFTSIDPITLWKLLIKSRLPQLKPAPRHQGCVSVRVREREIVSHCSYLLIILHGKHEICNHTTAGYHYLKGLECGSGRRATVASPD